MKKSILCMTGFIVTAALLFIGCDNSSGPKGSVQVDGFLDRVNTKPGSSGGDGEYSFKLTINSEGEGATRSGDYFVKGQTVNINAGTVEGRPFEKWTTTSSDITIKEPNSASTSFNMPAHNVTVTANFIPSFTVTISGGTANASGGGNYLLGATVNIDAGTLSGLRIFEKWTSASAGVKFDDASNAATSFKMPANNVTVTAVFRAWTYPGWGSVTDSRDGKKYKTTNIGGKTWMAENLNYTPKSGYSYCYDNDDSYCADYGRMYDWYTARDVCMTGWHLPSRDEWDNLMRAVGGEHKVIDAFGSSTWVGAGKKLKAVVGWGDSNGTDDFGFSALPTGQGYTISIDEGSFSNIGKESVWWTDTEASWGDGCCAYYRYMGSIDIGYCENDVDDVADGKNYVSAVRCLKND